MTKEELQSFIKQFPDKVSFYDGVNWFTKPIKRRPWYKMKDVTNIFEIMPDEAIEDDHLVIKYDNALLLSGKTFNIIKSLPEAQ